MTVPRVALFRVLNRALVSTLFSVLIPVSFGIGTEAQAATRQASQEVEVLSPLKDRAEFFLEVNQVLARMKLSCLTQYDLTRMSRDEVWAADPGCYETLSEFMSRDTVTYHRLRVLKVLTTPSISRFKDRVLSDPLKIEDSLFLSRHIRFDVYEKLLTSGSELDNPEMILAEDAIELKEAKEEFTAFYQKTCLSLRLPDVGRNDARSLPSVEAFCRLAIAGDRKAIVTKLNGQDLLRAFAQKLVRDYERDFRREHQEEFESKVAHYPYLVLIRSPETFKKDLRTAIAYSSRAAGTAITKFEAESKDKHLDARIALFKEGKLADEQIEVLAADLRSYFKLEALAQYFALSRDLKDPKLYASLLAEYQMRQLRWKIFESVGMATMTLLCFWPGSGTVATQVTKEVGRSALRQLGSRSAAVLRSVRFKAICGGAVLVPIQSYLTAESLAKSWELQDLFFATVNGSSLFTSFKQLDRTQREAFLYLLLSPLDLWAAVHFVRGLPALSRELKELVEAKLRERI